MRRALLLGGPAAVCSLTLAAPSLPPVSFAPRIDYNVGDRPLALVSSDFNQDGNQDIAVANYDSDSVSVLLGNGTGGFTGVGPFPTAAAPSAIATGLVNADEFPDLVVTADLDMKVSVLLGNGNGTFQDARNVDVGLGPNGVALADFDGDGRLDFANSNYFDDPGTVTVFLGGGDGTFSPAPGHCRLDPGVSCGDAGDCTGGTDRCDKFIEVAGGPYGIAAGNLNEDDFVDLAVTGYDTGIVFVLLGRGDGTFADAQVLQVGLYPPAVIIEDLNHDTKADLAVVDEETDSVYVFLGDGLGGFGEPTGFVVGGAPVAIAAADFNGDTFIDLVTADSFGNDEFLDSVSVLLGDGTGRFAQPALAFETDLCPFGVVASQLNEDTLADIATANDLAGSVSILANLGNGVPTATATPTTAVPTVTPDPSCRGDCDLDGTVAIDEVVLGVSIAFGDAPRDACASLDRNQSGAVEVDELLTSVDNALHGCPS